MDDRCFLIAADVHLSPDCPRLNERFFFALRQAAVGASAVFLLGDVFDTWVGDNDDSPWVVSVRQQLAAVTAAGLPVFIQRGNRDFLLSTRFMRETGCTLLPDEYVLQTSQSRWLFMHGDTLADDPGYHYFRRFIWPLLRLAAALLPLPTRHYLAGRLRAASRGSKGCGMFRLDQKVVTAALRRHTCTRLVHGHLHALEEVVWQDGADSFKRFCVPDWQSDKAGFAKIHHDVLSWLSCGDPAC